MLLVICLGICGFVPVARAASTPPARIGCWGDSLTFGTGTSPGLSFPSVLAHLLPGSQVYNEGIPGQTSPEIAKRFLADPDHWGDFTVIWVGRNNYSETTQVLGDIADMVAALPAPKRFVVLSVTTADFPNEYTGQSGANLIRSLNRMLKATYPANYLDIEDFLESRYNPRNPRDAKNHANRILPSSLRSDEIHLTARGYALVGQRVARFILSGRAAR
jgi:lysophospholipase L1-like esterase